MTDVTLVIDGKEFPAHRLILCASSDVFQVIYLFLFFESRLNLWFI